MHECFICSIVRTLTVHHIWPKSERGTNKLWNLMILCRLHHMEIEGEGKYKYGNRTPEVVKKYNDELIKRGLTKWKIEN